VTRPRLTYLAIVLGALLWCAPILLAPVLAAAGGVPARAASVIYQFFQPLCHQLNSRSFHLYGEPFAVCIRCSAIYFAFLAATLLFPLVCSVDRAALPNRRFLLVAALPMALDVCADTLGLHESTLLSRTVSGVVLGGILPFYIVPAAIEAVSGLSHPRDTFSPERKDP
jgi:uncharacterized membrane protein